MERRHGGAAPRRVRWKIFLLILVRCMKRVSTYSLGIICVIVVTLIFLRYRPENVVLAPRVQMLLSLLIVIGSVLLIRERCDTSALLLLVGSAGWTVFWALDVFSDYTWSKEPGPLDGCLYRHW